VVLVCDGCAEQRHDSVAGILVDGSLEAVDPFADDLEETVEHSVPILGTELLGQFHRALDVGE
jgi:hypothetical protein